MKKKLISLLLALAVVFSLTQVAFAASSEATQAAEVLYELGLFKGTSTNPDGTPVFDLDKTPTRNQAIIMLVRLLGKEEDALTGNWSIPFTDVSDSMKPYVGYAYANGLTNGYTTTAYRGTNPIKANQYIAFVLRALGYESGKDFEVNTSWKLSDSIGLTDGLYNAATKQFTRGDVAIISENALNVKYKSSTNMLLDGLVGSGAVVESAAKSYRSNLQAKWLVLSETTLTMKVGERKQLKATIYPENAISKAVTWESSAPMVVSVSSNGEVQAKEIGTAKITVKTANGRNAVCSITVKPIDAESITLDKTSLELKEGNSATLRATVTPSNAANQTLTWSSSNPSVATVSNGKVTAVRQGTAVIKVSASNGVAATCTVNVQGVKWYYANMYRVGTDIPAGDYYAVVTDSRYGGYYCKYEDSTKREIEDNDVFNTFTFLRIYNGQYLDLSRCKITAIENAPIATPNADGSYGEGTYRVGIDIPAGEYKFTATSSNSGYYCAYSDISYRHIVDNDVFSNSTYYTVKAGQYLTISRATAVCIEPSSSGGGNSSTTGIVYYDGYDGAPDFGAFIGVDTAFPPHDGGYSYKSSEVYAVAGKNAINQYMKLLTDCGFKYLGGDGNFALYKNSAGLTISIRIVTTSTGEYIIISVYY